MYKFLMVSTVFSKKQFTVVSCREDENFTNFLDEFRHRQNLILFPILNKEDINNIEDLLDEKELKSLLSEVQEANPYRKKFAVTNFTGFTVAVRCIEHIHYDLFRFYTDYGNFVSNSVQSCLIGKEGESKSIKKIIKYETI